MRVKLVDLELAVDALKNNYQVRLNELDRVTLKAIEDFAQERQRLEESMARDINSIRAAQMDLSTKVETSLL